MAHWEADESHIPPHTNEVPTNSTLNRITTILLREEPAADVYSIATICLTYFVSLFGFVLLLVGLNWYTGRRGGEEEEEEGMEMVGVKREGDGEEGMEERTESEGSGAETPLPIYSVDGAGR